MVRQQRTTAWCAPERELGWDGAGDAEFLRRMEQLVAAAGCRRQARRVVQTAGAARVTVALRRSLARLPWAENPAAPHPTGNSDRCGWILQRTWWWRGPGSEASRLRV